MKRTLLEILSGLAFLVIVVSFHHQIERLRAQSDEVDDLKRMVTEAVARAGSKEEISAVREQILSDLEGKLQELEARVAEASAQGEATVALERELAAARRETDRFKADIARDFSRTKELVDAYHEAIRAVERKAESGIFDTRADLEQLAGQVLPDAGTLSETMLDPTVQLNGQDTVGAGTLIYSGPNPESRRVETYVLTSFHVVRNILADTPEARREGIPVTIYGAEGKREIPGDMVVHDARIDAALVRLRSTETFAGVARVASRQTADRVEVWEPVYAVGCPLGNDPIPTQGEVSSTRNVLNGSNYWMINAPTYFGNSGGGIYLARTRELVGVFSKIYTHGRGNPVVVPHMGLCTPLSLVHEWLRGEKLAFVLEPAAADARLAATPGK